MLPAPALLSEAAALGDLEAVKRISPYATRVSPAGIRSHVEVQSISPFPALPCVRRGRPRYAPQAGIQAGLFEAAKHGHLDVARFFLVECHADAAEPDSTGRLVHALPRGVIGLSIARVLQPGTP
jgi:hypothetical protein